MVDQFTSAENPTMGAFNTRIQQTNDEINSIKVSGVRRGKLTLAQADGLTLEAGIYYVTGEARTIKKISSAQWTVIVGSLGENAASSQLWIPFEYSADTALFLRKLSSNQSWGAFEQVFPLEFGGGDLLSDGSIPMSANFNLAQHDIVGISKLLGAQQIDLADATALTFLSSGALKILVDAIETIKVTAQKILFEKPVEFSESVVFSGSVDSGGNRLTNLGQPSEGTDACTKSYTDSQTSTLAKSISTEATLRSEEVRVEREARVAADNTKLPLNGAAVMTGPLDLGSNKVINVADATTETDAVNKRVVDTLAAGLNTSIAACLPTDGSKVMTGNLNMGGNVITFDSSVAGAGINLNYGNLVFKVFHDGVMEMMQDGPWTALRTNALDLWKLNAAADGVEIYGLPEVPSQPNSAASKAYVDAHSGGGGFPVHQHFLDDSPGYTFDDATLAGVYAVTNYNPRGTGVPPDLLDLGIAFNGTLIVTSFKDNWVFQILQVEARRTPYTRYTNPHESTSWTLLGSGDFKSNGSIPMTGNLNINSLGITNIQDLYASNGVHINFWDALGFEISQSGRTLIQWNDKAITLEVLTRIENVDNPIADKDAANKSYVVSQIQADMNAKIKFQTTDPGVGASLATGAIFLVYE